MISRRSEFVTRGTIRPAMVIRVDMPATSERVCRAIREHAAADQ